MKGVADRDSMMQDMLAQAQPPAPEQEQDDPKALIDAAIERIAAYAENPEQVTPETIQELLGMLQQASAALGGGDESALPVGGGPEQVS
jgi:hypothetical protein